MIREMGAEIHVHDGAVARLEGGCLEAGDSRLWFRQEQSSKEASKPEEISPLVSFVKLVSRLDQEA